MSLRRGLFHDFALPLTRKEIPEMLGLTVKTVSRTITGFQHAGIIRASRGLIRILNERKLRALAEGAPALLDSSSPTWSSSNAPHHEATVIRYVRKTGTD